MRPPVVFGARTNELNYPSPQIWAFGGQAGLNGLYGCQGELTATHPTSLSRACLTTQSSHVCTHFHNLTMLTIVSAATTVSNCRDVFGMGRLFLTWDGSFQPHFPHLLPTLTYRVTTASSEPIVRANTRGSLVFAHSRLHFSLTIRLQRSALTLTNHASAPSLLTTKGPVRLPVVQYIEP